MLTQCLDEMLHRVLYFLQELEAVEAVLRLLPAALRLLTPRASDRSSNDLSQQLQSALHAAVEDGVMNVSNAAPLQQLLWLLEAPTPDTAKVSANLGRGLRRFDTALSSCAVRLLNFGCLPRRKKSKSIWLASFTSYTTAGIAACGMDI